MVLKPVAPVAPAPSLDSVTGLVASGRSRWKIENENNNTLKTKGYHFEHNDGHGQQHLATLFASLILLAFLVHTVLDRLHPGDREGWHSIRINDQWRVCFEWREGDTWGVEIVDYH